MVVVGVDLAAQPKSTAVCQILWEPSRAVVQALGQGKKDEELLGLMSSADKVGIDVPLGWPDRFVGWVSAHQRGEKLPNYSREDLCLRATDIFVRNQLKQAGIKRHPLSVSSTPLAITAIRAARLLAKLNDPDRAGRGKVCEVYPAAALDQWGLPSSRYKKKKGTSKRVELVSLLRERTTPWLGMTSSQWEGCQEDDNLLDALVAALVTRAAARGLTHPVPNQLAELTSQEGWIALPLAGSLERLAS